LKDGIDGALAVVGEVDAKDDFHYYYGTRRKEEFLSGAVRIATAYWRPMI
jgi:hypothetical protein